MKKIILLFHLLIWSYFSFSQCNGRYNTEIFSTVSKTTVTYSTIYNLEMDIYQPDGDIEICLIWLRFVKHLLKEDM